MMNPLKLDELRSLSSEPVPIETTYAASAHAERLRGALREASEMLHEVFMAEGSTVGQAVVRSIVEHGPAAFAAALTNAKEHSFSWHRTPAGVFLDVRLSLGHVEVPR